MTKNSRIAFISVFKKFSSIFTALAMIASTFAPLAVLPATASADTVSAGAVVINEFASDVTSGDSEWVELYNTTASSIDLTDWTISDAQNHVQYLTGSISAGGFATFDVSQLNNPGDTITLADSATTTIDSVAYGTGEVVGAPDKGESAGRAPDGSSNWVIFSTPSKNASNNGGTVTLSPTPPSSVAFGSAVTFTAESSDLKNPTYSISSGDPSIPATDINATTGVFSWTPTLTEIGTQTITVTATSGSYRESTTTTVTVKVPDDVPILNIDVPTPSLSVQSATATSGDPITLSATAQILWLLAPTTDISGANVGFSVNGVYAGSATTNDSGVATLTYTPTSPITAGSYPSGITASTTATAPLDLGSFTLSGSADLTITPAGPSASVTAEDFGTWDNSPSFKGINVGFETADFTSVSGITVDIYSGATLVAENTASAALINDINTQAGGFTQNGQLSSPFVISGALNDTYCAGGPCWTPGTYTWNASTVPTKTVITVTGTDANGAATTTAENDTFTQGEGTFASFFPPVENSCPVPDTLDATGSVTINPPPANETDLQDVFDTDGYTFNVGTDQTNFQAWNVTPGQEVSVSANFISKQAWQSSVFGYYMNGDISTFTPIFKSANITGYDDVPLYNTGPFTVTIPSAGTIGFAIKSYSGATYLGIRATQSSLNSGSRQQAVVYNPSSNEYLLAFEDAIGGDYDFNDLVVKLALGCSDIPAAPAAPTNLKFNYTIDGDADNGATLACGATVNSNKPTTYHEGGSLNLNWTAPAGTITGYQDLITYPDGSTDIAYQGPNNWSWITFGHGNGVYTYQVRANSANGLSPYSSACTIAYDTQSPTAQFDPVPPEYVNGNFTVSGEASDNVALKSVFFDVRDPHDTTGNAWRAGCVSGTQTTDMSADSKNATTSCTINTASLTEGYPYILRIHASDYAGYGSSGQQQTLILDTTRPSSVAITAPLDGSTQTGTFTITGTATDTLSGIDHVQIWVSKVVPPDPVTGKTFGGYLVDNQPATWDAGTGTFSYDVAGAADGTYDIKAEAFDKAGNGQFAPTPTITVQNPAPVYITTDAATNVTFSDATLNGTNDDSDAIGHSFWVSTSTFATSSANIPANVYSTHDFGSIAAHTDFSALLSSLTQADGAYVYGQTLGTMPAIAPNTTYYYVAWSHVGATWYPGAEQSFTTTAAPSVTTNAATNISQTDATLNGTNGAVDAQGYLFWVSKSAIDTSNPNVLPAGAVRTAVLGSAAAGQSFSVSLSSLTTAGVPSDLAAITPGTTYHYVAWVEVNGTWYPGADETLTTAAAPVKTALTLSIHQADLATSSTDVAANPTKWYFADDQADEINDTVGAFVDGPGTAPLGNGSAQLSVANANEGYVLGTQSFTGIPLSEIKTLSYATYRSAGDAALAPALQFDINSAGTTTPAHYEGRLVFEPYQTGATVETGHWQTWDAMTGTGWWFSHASATAADGKVVTTCTQASPCTWSQILAQFPDIGITGITGFKVGSGWTSGFTGNVDDFVIEINDSANDVTTTYDFEPRTGTITTITNAADLTTNASTVGVPFHVAWSVVPVTGIGTPSGTVEVTVNGGAGCSGEVSDGGCDITPTSIGGVMLQAIYDDDASFDQSSSATVTHQVSAATNSNIVSGGGGGGGPIEVVGDINGDGQVNFLDFALLMSAMGSTGTNLAADLNGDGKVDLADLAILMSHWTL